MEEGDKAGMTTNPINANVASVPTEAPSPATAADQAELDTLEDDDDDANFVPRGTLLFVLVMLLGYALYWAYLWFIVVIERGAGGV